MVWRYRANPRIFRRYDVESPGYRTGIIGNLLKSGSILVNSFVVIHTHGSRAYLRGKTQEIPWEIW